MIFGREPVAFMAMLNTLLALSIGFGVPVSPIQFGLIMAAAASVSGFIIRKKVVPYVPTSPEEEDSAS